VVLGADSVGVGFLQVDVPEMPDEQMTAVVTHQVQARLPLAADQIALTWRRGDIQAGQAHCVIATARTRYVEDFARRVQSIRADHIFLDAEAVVEIWKQAFDKPEQEGIIISLNEHSTLLCAAHQGRLQDAITIDTGLSDIGLASDHEEERPGGLREQFLQDLQGAWERLGTKQQVFILSGNTGDTEQIVTWLSSLGIAARVVKPAEKALAGVDQARLYTFRIPLGLALMGLQPSASWLDLFKEFCSTEGQKGPGVPKVSSRAAAVMAACMLVVLLAALVVTDILRERRLRTLMDQDTMKARIAQRTLQKQIAQYRPDILRLLDNMAGGEHPGIVLDSVTFNRGQPVRLTGHAEQAEQMYQYQKALIETSGIRDVQLEKPAKDKKTNKVKFTMTFHYRQFTTRRAKF
jgi:hypothetical protein